MLEKIFIQIIDNPFENIIYSDTFEDIASHNRALAEELQILFDLNYPTMVSVEYIDLFFNEDENFQNIREMLSHGVITLPFILVNGTPLYYGAISNKIIIDEIEKRLSSGPIH